MIPNTYSSSIEMHPLSRGKQRGHFTLCGVAIYIFFKKYYLMAKRKIMENQIFQHAKI
jgi:hypothetical protein